MITVTFKCGHSAEFKESISLSPVCECGERQVTRVIPRRMPVFRGTVRGPVSEYKALDPTTVDLAPGGSLKLKGQN